MNYFLLPSLQHAATVRTASLLYNEYEVDNMLDKDRSISLRQRWQLVEKEIADKLSPFLPPVLQNAVSKVICPMHDGEVREWKDNHEYLLKHLGGCCSAWLLWKTDGRIDRTETAKRIVANENIDPKIRFVLACTYFLEEEVLALWERIRVRRRRKRLVLDHTNEAVDIFRKWFPKKGSRHWTEMVDEYFRSPPRMMGPTGREVAGRKSCYYPFLSKELRLKFVQYLVRSSAHSDDFPICWNNMNETERIEVWKFRFPIVLYVCLKWPYRYHFIKMAKEVFNYLTSDIFVTIIKWMLRAFMQEADDDFHLFEEFWQMCPASFKDKAKRDKYFIPEAEFYLKSEDCPEALKEILKRCCFD